MRRKFINDKYRKVRNGRTHLLKISCSKCGNYILEYQKDGIGSLKRLYLDRIFSPKNLMNLEKKSIKELGFLQCSKCKKLLGMPMIYKRENRKSFRLFAHGVKKERVALN